MPNRSVADITSKELELYIREQSLKKEKAQLELAKKIHEFKTNALKLSKTYVHAERVQECILEIIETGHTCTSKNKMKSFVAYELLDLCEKLKLEIYENVTGNLERGNFQMLYIENSHDTEEVLKNSEKDHTFNRILSWHHKK